MKSSAFRLSILLLVLTAAAVPVLGQLYKLPAKTQVTCAGCPGQNVHNQPNDGLPTVAYGSPIVNHVGRIVDSTSTENMRLSFRTARSGKIRIAKTRRGTAPPRAYIQLGDAIAAYTLDTFFTTSLPGGMQPISKVRIDPKISACADRNPCELVTLPDAYVYPEAKGSGWVPNAGGDDQDVFGDMDFDDRGYVYGAFTSHGWGIMKDSGETGAAQLPLVSPQMTDAVQRDIIVSLKSGSKYYVVISELLARKVNIYDATNPASPKLLLTRSGTQWGIKRSWSKDPAGRLAYLAGNGKVYIFEPGDYVNGGAPLAEITAGASKTIQDVAFDENGHLWIAEGVNAVSANVLRRYAPSGAGYAETKYDLGAFSALKIHAGDGYVMLMGWGPGVDGADSLDARLYKVEGNSVRNIDLDKYFSKYYHRAPLNFAQPQALPNTYTQTPKAVQVVEWNNKTYIMWSVKGVGDVYEIEGGGAVNATMKTTSFGTPNPNSKSTEAGPFYGDFVTFNGVSTLPSTISLVWNFGNPESGIGRNIGNSKNGHDITHQYSDLSTAAAISTAKTVTVEDAVDPGVKDTLTVALKVPKARVGAPGNTTLTANTTGLKLLAGDVFTDASDGAIEGHVTTWTLDGAPLQALPNASALVGGVGAHTMTMSASYGRYDSGTLAPSGDQYVAGPISVTYTALPFLFSFKNPVAAGSAVTFGAIARKTDDAAILTANQWKATWELKNGVTDLVTPQVSDVNVGVIPNFTLPNKSIITSGSVLRLTIQVDPSGLSPAAQPYNVYTDSMVLDAPDPQIAKTGCANAYAPCSFTASSESGKSMSDWSLAWTLTKGTATIATGTANPFPVNLTEAGSYKITVKATKSGGIFEKTTELTFTAEGATCGPVVSVDDLTIWASCYTNCAAGTEISFRADLFHYKEQDCDEWLWDFGDNTAGSGRTVGHTYTANGTYKVSLKAKNPNGQTNAPQITIKIGTDVVEPPPDCTAPTTVSFTYQGLTTGCVAGTDCKLGESIRFSARKNGGNLQTCDSVTWKWGDNTPNSSARTGVHSFSAAGTYPVKMTITNEKGTSTEVTQNVKVVATTAPCSTSATADEIYVYYHGRESNCSDSNGVKCKKGEAIDFDVVGFPYQFQSCDQFDWKFGDGGTAASKNPEHTYTGAGNAFEVTLRVYNTSNPTGATKKHIIQFEGAPVEPVPTLTPTFPKNGSKGKSVTFTVGSNIATTTGWTWDFGDGNDPDTSQAGKTDSSNTITHTFAEPGEYTVTVQARNGKDPSTVLTATATGKIKIVDVTTWQFLLPVTIHDNGQNGSVWRTDVQVYHPTASQATPLNMTAKFQGQEHELQITQSTFIYEDFLNYIVAGQKTSGPVLITTQNDVQPQIWTRTYNLAANGGTFGQFIPAILLNTGGGSGAATPALPKYYLAGIRNDSRFRTNVGFVNLTTSDLPVKVEVYDDVRYPVGVFNLNIPAYSLQQFPLSSKLENLPAKPLSLDIQVPQGAQLFAYASLIDSISNDPVLITAVADGDVASEDFRISVTPGVGRTGPWRSDVTIFNPDIQGVDFDLEYYDQAGTKQAEAKGIRLGPLQFIQYEDLLRANVLTPTPPDSVGSLRIKTNTPPGFTTNRFPVSFSRTYNDKGDGTGTFGQGINGFGSARANVKPGKKALIPAVRSDESYYTNIGLTNVSNVDVNVIVRLLDPNTGIATSAQASYALKPNQTTVGQFDFKGLTRGTLEVVIDGTQGAVWAFGSVIDRKTADPEYVPATALP